MHDGKVHMLEELEESAKKMLGQVKERHLNEYDDPNLIYDGSKYDDVG